MDSGQPEITQEIKVAVRSVLLSQKGVKIERFLRDFRSLMGYPLEFRKLGFKSLRSFINAIPDVARIEFCQKENTDKLYAIADPKSYLPDVLKKNLSGSRGDFRSRGCQIRDDPSTPRGEPPIPGELAAEYREQLVPNMKKLYAICFPKRCLSREHVSKVFGEFGNLAETSFTEKMVFVRYFDREHAIKALLQLEEEYAIKIPTELSTPRHVIKRGGFSSTMRKSDNTGYDVYIGNLAEGLDVATILKMLPGMDIKGARLNSSGMQRFCFIKVDTEKESEEVISRLNGKLIEGQRVVAQLSFKNKDKGLHEEGALSQDPNILRNMSRKVVTKLSMSIGNRDENQSDDEGNGAVAAAYDDMPDLEDLDGDWDEPEEEEENGCLDNRMAALTVTIPGKGRQSQPPVVSSPEVLSPTCSGPTRPGVTDAVQRNVVAPPNSKATAQHAQVQPLGRGQLRKVVADSSVGRNGGVAALLATKARVVETPNRVVQSAPAPDMPSPPGSQVPPAGPERLATPQKSYQAAVRIANFCYQTTEAQLWELFKHSNPARIVMKPVVIGEAAKAILLYDNLQDACIAQAMDGVMDRGRRLYITLSDSNHKYIAPKPSNISCMVRQTDAPKGHRPYRHGHAGPPLHSGHHPPGPHGDGRHMDYNTGPGPHLHPAAPYPGSPPGAHGDSPQAPIAGYPGPDTYMKRGLLGDSPASHNGAINSYGRHPATEAAYAKHGHMAGYHGHKTPSMHHGYRGDLHGPYSPHGPPGASHHAVQHPHASYHQAPLVNSPPNPSHGHANTTPRELAMQMHITRMAEECFPEAVALYTPDDLEEELCIVLTSITDDSHFWGWVMNDDNMADISDLMDKMSQVEGTKMPFNRNVPRCAAFNDGDWYRAYLVGMKPNGRAHVYLIDYGCEEMIPLDCMATLPDDYWEMAPQAVPFRVLENTSGSGLQGRLECVVRACCIQQETDNENVIKVCLLEWLQDARSGPGGILKQGGSRSMAKKSVSFS